MCQKLEKAKAKLNYIGRLIVESLELNHRGDNSYRLEKANELLKDNNKLNSLFFLFNVDAEVRNTFAQKIGTNNEDFKIFMKILQKV